MLEIKHFKSLQALAQTGSLIRAAERLFTSQSALSHQLKELEERLQVSLFERKSKPIRFTPQGETLLKLAASVLPDIAAVEAQLKGSHQSAVPLKTLGIECHACFQWLLPTIKHFNHQQMDYQLELISDTLFDGEQALLSGRADLLFTDQPVSNKQVLSSLIGKFEVLLAMASNDDLAQREVVTPSDLCSKRLLTYPLDPQKLDIFTDFLLPAHCQPHSVKQVDNSHTILQMVGAGMGVAALPDWLLRTYAEQQLVATAKLGTSGIRRSLYAHYLPANQALAACLLADVSKNFQELLQ